MGLSLPAVWNNCKVGRIKRRGLFRRDGVQRHKWTRLEYFDVTSNDVLNDESTSSYRHIHISSAPALSSRISSSLSRSISSYCPQTYTIGSYLESTETALEADHDRQSSARAIENPFNNTTIGRFNGPHNQQIPCFLAANALARTRHSLKRSPTGREDRTK